MAEYIDREKLLDDLLAAAKHGGMGEIIAQTLMRYVKRQFAADVAPVVHGRWDIMKGTKTRRICSKCGWDVPGYGKFYSYCPNCGAKMDGGEVT